MRYIVQNRDRCQQSEYLTVDVQHIYIKNEIQLGGCEVPELINYW